MIILIRRKGIILRLSFSTMFYVYINQRYRYMITKPQIHYLLIHSYRGIYMR